MARHSDDGKNTVEGCRSIDVLEWHRRGYLRSLRCPTGLVRKVTEHGFASTGEAMPTRGSEPKVTNLEGKTEREERRKQRKASRLHLRPHRDVHGDRTVIAARIVEGQRLVADRPFARGEVRDRQHRGKRNQNRNSTFHVRPRRSDRGTIVRPCACTIKEYERFVLNPPHPSVSPGSRTGRFIGRHGGT